MFQSPSLWGQHCWGSDSGSTEARFRCFSPLRYGDSIVGQLAATGATVAQPVSVPFAMGTALLATIALSPGPLLFLFQSPSLWGQHCWFRQFKAMSQRFNVSVPFAMGTALLVARRRGQECMLFVSVPFAMGTALLGNLGDVLRDQRLVSVPFAMGTALLVASRRQRSSCRIIVSVPFAMGTALLAPDRVSCRSPTVPFQSPSLWGQHCWLQPPLQPCRGAFVSVPFAMGTALLARTVYPAPCPISGFSPLRYGDSIVGETDQRLRDELMCFSPLRYGDSIVGVLRAVRATALSTFQSPSLWGQHCWTRRRAGTRSPLKFQSPSLWGQHCWAASPMPRRRRSLNRFSPLRYGDSIVGPEAAIPMLEQLVSVPFAMGTALLAHRTEARCRRLDYVSVPFAMGTAL